MLRLPHWRNLIGAEHRPIFYIKLDNKNAYKNRFMFNGVAEIG